MARVARYSRAFVRNAVPLIQPAVAVSISKSADPQIRLADPQSAENLKGERKTITGLFAYIAGSTEERDPDPEEARASIDPALKLMIDAARRYHGYVLQSTGEGIFALFGANSSDASALWSRYACGRFQRLEREIAYAPSVSDASQGG